MVVRPVGPSSQGQTFFSRNTVARPVGPSSQGETFFPRNTGGPSGGSLLSGGGIIIFCVIRRHFLAAAVDPAVSLSMYSPRPMEVVPSTLTTPRREHQGGGRRRGLGRGRRGAGEDAAVDAQAERSMRVHFTAELIYQNEFHIQHGKHVMFLLVSFLECERNIGEEYPRYAMVKEVM